MPTLTFGWTLAGLTCLLLAVATWRRVAQTAHRAVLVVVASAGVTLALSGTPWSLLLVLAAVLLVAVTWRLVSLAPNRFHTAWVAVLVLILVLSKLPFFASYLGPAIWVGISYIFLRLVHIMVDARQGILGDVTLSQMMIYVLHPATLVAGPIDRVQHSVEAQSVLPQNPAAYFNEGIWRLLTGLIKKLILANAFYTLTVTFDAVNGLPPVSGTWIWLFAYSFYLYFDFAAYSDVAIGVGLMLGMRLPENFANPYLQPNITQFWQTWHITLSNWLRSYIFFPTSRSLLRRFGSRFSSQITLVSHLVTMIASGLWHGFRLELVAWGIWHGLGLYVHNRWTMLQRRHHLPSIPRPLAVVVTYLFVTLGWVFFSMRLSHALRIMAHLVGVR